MATYTVSRKTWYRGRGRDESRLLREDGTRCCIGFVGQQCGISDAVLLNRNAIGQSWQSGHIGGFPAWMVKGQDIYDAYRENDDIGITDEERESRLQEIFAKHGDEIVFVD